MSNPLALGALLMGEYMASRHPAFVQYADVPVTTSTGEMHAVTLSAASLFDEAHQAIQTWSKMWWLSKGSTSARVSRFGASSHGAFWIGSFGNETWNGNANRSKEEPARRIKGKPEERILQSTAATGQRTYQDARAGIEAGTMRS